MEHTFVLGSAWSFVNPHNLLDSFESSSRSSFGKLTCSFDNKMQQFKIKCSSDHQKELSAAFLDEIRREVDNESRKIFQIVDLYEAPNVIRKSTAQDSVDAQTLYALVDRQDAQTILSRTDGQEEPLIGHETTRKSWTPRLFRDAIPDAFPNQVLRAVENSAGCRMELQETTIDIIADSEAAIDRAISKMTVIEDAHVASSRRLHFDFYVDEGDTGYHFRFNFPLSIVDDSLWRRERTLKTHYELTLVRLDQISRQYNAIKNFGSLMPIECEGEPILWTNAFEFEYGDGDGTNNPGHWHEFLQGHGIIANRLAPRPAEFDTVARWTQQVHPLPSDAFSVSDRPSTLTHAPGSVLGRRDRTVRRARGQPAHDDLLGGQLAGLVLKSEPATMPAIEPIPEIPSGNIEAKQTTQLPRIVRTSPRRLVRPAPHEPTLRGRLVDTSFGNSVENPWPPITPSRDFGCSLDSAQVHEPQDSIQTESESASRLFHTTTSLLAFRARPPRPRMELDANIWSGIEQLLAITRTRFHAKVHLEIVLGKILVQGSTVPDEWRHNRIRAPSAFAPECWSSIFRTHRNTGNASTILSEKLTGSWVDAEYLIEQLYDNGILSKPTSESAGDVPDQTTTFELHCRDERDGAEALIEIDNEQQSSIFETWDQIGHVNMHFPKRVWDASLVIKAARRDTVETRARFQEIVNSLWIRGPGQMALLDKPILALRRENKWTTISSIHMRREVAYKPKNGSSHGVKIRLILVQKLRVEQMQEGRLCGWIASIHDKESTNSQWWGVKLTSDTMDKIFEERNGTLEIGEIADYDLQNAEVSVRDLVQMARLMVPLMDSVGLRTNHCKLGSNAASSSARRRGNQAGEMI